MPRRKPSRAPIDVGAILKGFAGAPALEANPEFGTQGFDPAAEMMGRYGEHIQAVGSNPLAYPQSKGFDPNPPSFETTPVIADYQVQNYDAGITPPTTNQQPVFTQRPASSQQLPYKQASGFNRAMNGGRDLAAEYNARYLNQQIEGQQQMALAQEKARIDAANEAAKRAANAPNEEIWRRGQEASVQAQEIANDIAELKRRGFSEERAIWIANESAKAKGSQLANEAAQTNAPIYTRQQNALANEQEAKASTARTGAFYAPNYAQSDLESRDIDNERNSRTPIPYPGNEMYSMPFQPDMYSISPGAVNDEGKFQPATTTPTQLRDPVTGQPIVKKAPAPTQVPVFTGQQEIPTTSALRIGNVTFGNIDGLVDNTVPPINNQQQTVFTKPPVIKKKPTVNDSRNKRILERSMGLY